MCQQDRWSQAIALLAHWTALDPPEELFLRLSLTWHFDYSSAPCPPPYHNHHHQTNMALSLLPQCGKLRSDGPDVGNVFKCIKIKILEGSRNEFCIFAVIRLFWYVDWFLLIFFTVCNWLMCIREKSACTSLIRTSVLGHCSRWSCVH